ncbi:MAG: RNA-binding protein [Faecousia sp.]
MDRSNIEKIAKTTEDKLLLAKLWDKIDAGMRKNIPAATCFLSPRELELARYLFGTPEGLHEFGGFGDAERKMLIFLPDYLDESELTGPDSPIVCLRASFFQGDCPSHRDFLGALMGAGLGRESIGDICVGKGSCDFFVTSQIAPYLLSNFTGAGRTHVQLEAISLADVQVPEPEVKQIKDTLASLRLDSVIASGFRIGRSLASQYISAGKAAVDGLPCEKPDKQVPEGAKISVRGLGKIKLAKINGTTKKDRISVVLHRYV